MKDNTAINLPTDTIINEYNVSFKLSKLDLGNRIGLVSD